MGTIYLIMNSYELSRNFWDFSFDNPDMVKPYHAAIYFFSIEHCNRLGWKEKFGFPTSMVMEATGIKSYGSYKKYFDDLVEWKFFKVIEYSKNQFSSNIIALTSNNKAQVKAGSKALDKALIKHGSKQSESTGQSTVQSISSVDKPLTNNKEQINKEQVYTKDVHNCFKRCLTYFPNHLQPKKETEWLEVIDKLNRIDNIPYDAIEKITQGARKDDFWAKNFLSLTKLRKKNKDGIMYIVVFNEHLKSTTNGKQGVTSKDLADAYQRLRT